MSEMLPDPSKALDEVWELTRQGRFAEALERQLWFHNHALEYNPHLSAVRLSFGLAAWSNLAKQHPPAREALVAVRDRLAAAIRADHTSFAQFQELAAINDNLDDQVSTGEIFLAIRMSDPEAAQRYYSLAEKGLVACEAYAVCAYYIPDATAQFVKLRMDRRFLLNHSRVDPFDDGAGIRKAAEMRFAADIRRLVKILVAVGRTAEAERVRKSAIAETESEKAREVIAALEVQAD